MKWFRIENTEQGIAVLTMEVASLVSANICEIRRSGIFMALATNHRVVIDLAALRYFDVRGFAEILSWVAQADKAGEVRVCSESREVHALLELLRGPSFLTCYGSQQEALSSFSSGTNGFIPEPGSRGEHLLAHGGK
jgi:anti-anti-sigma regulatory factor